MVATHEPETTTEGTTGTATIPVLDRRLAGLADIAARDRSRPVLAGVCIAVDQAAAADGFMLLELTLPRVNPDDLPAVLRGAPVAPKVILPAKAFSAAVKAIPRQPNFPLLEHATLTATDGGMVRIASTDLDTTNAPEVRPVDGTYPDFAQIIPDGEPEASITFDAALMVTMLKAMIVAEAGKTGSGREAQYLVRLNIYGPMAAMKMSAKDPDGRPVRGVLMPMVAGRD